MTLIDYHFSNMIVLIRGLKNFQAEQPHQHAVYYNSVVLSERVWHKEELLGALPELTVRAVEDFIPRLLGSLHVECLVYGNCTDSLALDLYGRVVSKLKTECKVKYDHYHLSLNLLRDFFIQATSALSTS